jgi:hypothetical protein
VLLAVSRWYLGETDRNGTSSLSAWQQFGYDVDLLNTADPSGDGYLAGEELECSCTPFGGVVNGPNLEDGPAGVDNSFGKNVLSFLSSILENPSEQATESVEEGNTTLAFHLPTLGSAADYNPLPGAFYHLRNGFDGTWEYAPETLQGGDPDAPTTTFAQAYVTGDTWVSAPTPVIDVTIDLGGLPFELRVHDAVVTMTLSADRTSARDGHISGTLDTEELVTTIGEIASAVAGDTEGLCPGDQLFESIVQNIRSASDILADGTQQNGAPCTGITIGLGFDAQAVEAADVAEPREPPEPSNCD